MERARGARCRSARRAGKNPLVLYERRLDRADEGDPEREYVRRLCAGLLKRAAEESGLGPAERTAWAAVRIHGLSLDEAAAALGCPKTTLKQRLWRARIKIRAWLEDLGISSLDDIT